MPWIKKSQSSLKERHTGQEQSLAVSLHRHTRLSRDKVSTSLQTNASFRLALYVFRPMVYPSTPHCKAYRTRAVSVSWNKPCTRTMPCGQPFIERPTGQGQFLSRGINHQPYIERPTGQGQCLSRGIKPCTRTMPHFTECPNTQKY